jgi:predicted 2-oxoglutarate/Fe(II)-dependent dioxygenase YbiX
MSRAPAPGDLVVYRTLSGVGVARAEIVRDRIVTAFPWRQAERRWDRRRFRIDRRDVVAALPRETDPAPIADQFNVLTNRRAAERMQANRVFDQRVGRVLAAIGEEA